jgi:hypothetical protein
MAISSTSFQRNSDARMDQMLARFDEIETRLKSLVVSLENQKLMSELEETLQKLRSRQCRQVITTDLLDALGNYILPRLPLEDCLSCCFVVKAWYNEFSPTIFSQIKAICTLRTIDSDPSKPQVRIDPIQLCKRLLQICPHVEANAGCTLLTMRNLKIGELAEKILKEYRIGVVLDSTKFLQPESAPEKEYVVLIANGLLKKSRRQSYPKQIEAANALGGRLSTLTECLALYYFTLKKYGIKSFPPIEQPNLRYPVPAFVNTSSLYGCSSVYQDEYVVCERKIREDTIVVPFYFGPGSADLWTTGIPANHTEVNSHGAGYACELEQEQ